MKTSNQPKKRIMTLEGLTYYESARSLISERMRAMDGIGKRLQGLRECTDPLSKLPHPLSKVQVSEFLGITSSNIGRYEDYPNTPTSTRISIDMLVFLSTLYGVPMEYIMYGTLPTYIKKDSYSQVAETPMPYAKPGANVTAMELREPITEKLKRHRAPNKNKVNEELIAQMAEMQKKMNEMAEKILKTQKGV